MKRLISVVMLVFLAGCSSDNALTRDQKMQIVDMQSRSKTFEISCTSGCSVSYKDPRDQPVIPTETNGYDVASKAIGTVGSVLTTVAPWAAVGAVAVQGINKAGSQTTGSYNTTTDNTHTPAVVTTDKVQVVNPTVVTTDKVQVVNPVVVPTDKIQVVNPVVVTP